MNKFEITKGGNYKKEKEVSYCAESEKTCTRAVL